MSEAQAQTPEVPAVETHAAEQTAGPAEQTPAPPGGSPAVLAAGTRASLRAIARELSGSELANSGVSKLLIESLEIAETECVSLREYIGRYYEKREEAAVLKAQVAAFTRVEVLYGIGTTLGGVLIGLSPAAWSANVWIGPVTLAFGVVFVGVSTAVRIQK